MTNLRLTDNQFSNREEEQIDNNDLMNHFCDIAKNADWLNVSEEGLRVFNLMFSEEFEVERNSPLYDFITAIAAGAHHSVMHTIARAVGKSAHSVELALRDLFDNPPKQPLSWVALGELIESCEGRP